MLIFLVPVGVVALAVLEPTFVTANPGLFAAMFFVSIIFALLAYSLLDRGRRRN